MKLSNPCTGALLRPAARLLAAALLCVQGWAHAADTGSASAVLLPSLYVSTDSEDFHVRKLGAGIMPLYQDGNHYTGLKAAHHHFSVGDWSADSTQVTLASTAIDPNSGLGYQAGIGVNALGERELLTADLEYSFALGSATSAALSYLRDWVETPNSLDKGVSLNYVSASLEHRFGPGWTAIGLLGQHRFSDDNIRNHARVRLVYDLLPELGLNVQYRHRHFWNSQPANGNYFNPDAYYENMLALGLRRKLSGWMLSGTLGLGRQQVAGDPQASTHLAEFEAVSPLAGQVYFKTRLGYSDSANFNGPDYIHRYLQAELLLRF